MALSLIYILRMFLKNKWNKIFENLYNEIGLDLMLEFLEISIGERFKIIV